MDAYEEESEQRGLPLGRVLADSSDRLWGITAAVVALAGAALVVVGIVTNQLWLIAGGLVAIVVGALLARFLAGGWAAWANPQLHLPSSEDLHLGDHVTVRFKRRARGRTSTAGVEVSGELVVTERYRRPQGATAGGSTMATHEIYRSPVEVTLLDVVGPVVEADLVLDIPLAAAPATIDLKENAVVWTLDVDIAAPGSPDDRATFPLVVAPQVANRILDGGVGR